MLLSDDPVLASNQTNLCTIVNDSVVGLHVPILRLEGPNPTVDVVKPTQRMDLLLTGLVSRLGLRVPACIESQG